MSTIVKRAAPVAAALFLSLSGAQAATLDFTTATYANSSDGLAVNDTVDGVNFSITPTAKGTNGFRQDSLRGGLSFGVPGNGMYTISIVADQDVVFNSMYGNGHGFTAQANQLSFDIDVGGTEVSGDNMFAPAPHFSTLYETVNFADGPIAVSAGQSFFFRVDFDALGGGSVFASALVRSLDFSTVASPSPVPLPAGLPLLIGGVGILAVVRRRKQNNAA